MICGLSLAVWNIPSVSSFPYRVRAAFRYLSVRPQLSLRLLTCVMRRGLFPRFFRISTHSSRFLPTVAAERVTVKSKYQRRMNAMPFVSATTYGRAMLGANKLLLTVLFSDHYFGVQFVKDVGLIPTSMVSCKCGSKMYWCVDTKPPTIDRFSLCAYWDIQEHDREHVAARGVPESIQPEWGITSVN